MRRLGGLGVGNFTSMAGSAASVAACCALRSTTMSRRSSWSSLTGSTGAEMGSSGGEGRPGRLEGRPDGGVAMEFLDRIDRGVDAQLADVGQAGAVGARAVVRVRHEFGVLACRAGLGGPPLEGEGAAADRALGELLLVGGVGARAGGQYLERH